MVMLSLALSSCSCISCAHFLSQSSSWGYALPLPALPATLDGYHHHNTLTRLLNWSVWSISVITPLFLFQVLNHLGKKTRVRQMGDLNDSVITGKYRAQLISAMKEAFWHWAPQLDTHAHWVRPGPPSGILLHVISRWRREQNECFPQTANS